MNDPKEKQQKRFKKLDQEWRDEAISMDELSLDKEIKKQAGNIINSRIAKELDEDIARLTEELKTAKEPYVEGEKMSMLRIEFLFEVLRGKGADVPSIEDFLSDAAEGA